MTNRNLASVTIGGSLKRGTGSFSGSIRPALELTTLTITGDIIGGSASGAANLTNTGSVRAMRIGTLTLGGSLIAGTDSTTGDFFFNGAISFPDDIASATIKGSIIRNGTNRALISAWGQAAPVGTTDLAIGKLTVNGRVEYGTIVAGDGGAFGRPNADAQIGLVVVGHDWIASDLVACATAGGDGKFGTGDDTKISGAGTKDVANVFSKITSTVIGGQVLGTVAGADHFGFVAENIGSFKVKGGITTFPRIAGNGNDDRLLSLFTNDLRLNEI